MKNLLKIMMIFIFVIVCSTLTSVFADTYNANDEINLGKYNIYYRQGASYIRYQGRGQMNYMYYYKDYNNIEHKAFCLNLGMKGAEDGDYVVDADKLIDDPKVASILISGSPYKTLAELGLNNEDEASFATQFAVWIYLNNLDINQITPYSNGNENVVEAIKRIYHDGMNMQYTSEALIDINKIGNVDIDTINRKYYSQLYQLDYNTNIKNISLSTKGIQNVQITDINNNEIDSINNTKDFKVLIPRASVLEDKELLLDFRIESKQTSVMFGATNISDRQNVALLLDPINFKNLQSKLNVKHQPTKVKLKKVDKDTGLGIKGVTFRFETLEGKELGNFITNQEGEIELDAEKDLKIMEEQQIRVTETATPEEYYIDKENCTQIIKIEFGTTAMVEFQNEKIKGEIIVKKYSSEYNKYTSILANSPLKDIMFEVIDSNNKVVDILTTDSNGLAVSKTLLKGKYKLREIKQGKYYLLNNTIYDVEIKDPNESIEIIVYNDSVDIDIEIQKQGFIETQNKDTIFYNFKNIHNKSNVPLDSFTWNDSLPTEAVRVDRIYTGTWNEKLEYSVWYKTNQSNFKIFKDQLDTEIVYELNFNELILAENEYVTEIEFRFKTVKADFHEVESPIVYVNVLDGLKNGYSFTNHTKVSGNYLEEYIEAQDKWSTIIYNKEIKLGKELPKTGC